MNNPYRRLKEIVEEEHIQKDELLHCLVAIVFSESCEQCNQKFHSDAFADNFRRLIREMKLCRVLSRKRKANFFFARLRSFTTLWFT